MTCKVCVSLSNGEGIAYIEEDNSPFYYPFIQVTPAWIEPVESPLALVERKD